MHIADVMITNINNGIRVTITIKFFCSRDCRDAESVTWVGVTGMEIDRVCEEVGSVDEESRVTVGVMLVGVAVKRKYLESFPRFSPIPKIVVSLVRSLSFVIVTTVMLVTAAWFSFIWFCW